MQQWEYKVLNWSFGRDGNATEFENSLNLLGRDRWEMIGWKDNGMIWEMIFKRVRSEYAE